MLYDFSRVVFSGNYVSPSGGFCNYGEFSGRGINPETGRSNQIKKVSARTLEEAVSKAEKETGFHHIELSAVPMDPPTERQIAYAKELSIKIPEGACKEDVMCLISRVADSPSDVPSPGCSQALASYLEKSGICFSAYISQPMALSWAVNMLPDREKCRFYAYCVWCHISGEPIESPTDHSKAALFQSFVERFAENQNFTSELKKKTVDNFVAPNGNENTVKAVKAFFWEHEGHLPSNSRETRVNNKTEGGNMICPKCGSQDVNVQMVSETQITNKHHSIFWWLFWGWYWVPFKWLFLTLPAIIVKIFAPKRQKLKTQHKSMWVCQSCGNHWEA